MTFQKVYKSQTIKNNNMLPGDRNGSPDESFYSKEYVTNNLLVFIDAAFVSKLSKHFGKGKYLIYDVIKFAKLLAEKENGECLQIFYYTAPPFQSDAPTKEEESKKEGYDSFVKKLKKRGVTIREGRCQRLKIDDKFEYKQKAVDVFLAMDLTNIPVKYPDVKKIILIATNSDFVPVIENIAGEGIRTILYTYYEKKRDAKFSRSNELIKSVHKYVLLPRQDFDSAPLEKEVNLK